MTNAKAYQTTKACSQSADPRLSLRDFAADRPALPSYTNLLGICAERDRHERRMGWDLAHLRAHMPVPSLRHVWLRSCAGPPICPCTVLGAMAVHRARS